MNAILQELPPVGSSIPEVADPAAHTKLEHSPRLTREHVQQNRVPIALGVLVLGLSVGCALLMARRKKASFRKRYVDEPLNAVREAVYATLGPMAHRIHEGYDSAVDGTGRAMAKMHLYPSNHGTSWLHRAGNHLKLW